MRVSRVPILFVVLVAACGGKSVKEDGSPDIVGKPPSAADDPFFDIGLPADAQPAATSGKIEEDTKSADSTPAGPTKAPDETWKCMSCVQICEVGQRCEDDAELICGWGAAKSQKVATQRAQAECDGALRLASYSPSWSRIEGECPEPTCEL